ncbi:MAG: zinc ribbon domain-containing protein [Deltaproteobacteria bacterium]|nr:zinc ribbon domain-containing protein [Deltaproteobacteria bacterium]MBW2123652.1 zinc ribbon domain-containing protein [Deltaproteobacteria bacterium]
MPIYEYRCKACGHVFEMIRGISDKDEEVVCPECRRMEAEKLLSLFSSSGTASQGSSCGPGPFT